MKFIDFLNESKHKYTVDVEVRDASKANDIAKDMFRGAYKNDGSNVFVFKDEGDRDEFAAQLDKQKLKYDSLDERKLPAFGGFMKGSKVKFNDPKGPGPDNKVKTFVGTVRKTTSGKENVEVNSKAYGSPRVIVPYEDIQGVVK